ncbi:MAG: hypothetical protein QXI71_03185 [Candidatus Bathyarchaeia archaeon]
MPSYTEDEIRLRILQLLAKPPKKGASVWGVHKSIIREAIPVPERDIDVNISYLARNGLVKLVQVHGADWLWARITPVGLDVLQNPARYEERYTFVSK